MISSIAMPGASAGGQRDQFAVGANSSHHVKVG